MYVLYSLQTLKEMYDDSFISSEIIILGIFDNRESIDNYLSTTYQTPLESYEKIIFNDKRFFIKTCTINEGGSTMDTEILIGV